MGKSKRNWVHIDSFKDENSEFDSLGAVEELKDYAEEDLSAIISESLRGPKKKKQKLKSEADDANNSDHKIVQSDNKLNPKVETTAALDKEKYMKRKKKKDTKQLTKNPEVTEIVDGDKVKETKDNVENDSEKEAKPKKKKKRKGKGKGKGKKKKQESMEEKGKEDSNIEQSTVSDEQDNVLTDEHEKSQEKKQKKKNKKETQDARESKDAKKNKKETQDAKESKDTKKTKKQPKDAKRNTDDEDEDEVVEKKEVQIDDGLELIDIKDKWANMGIPDEIMKALFDKRFTEPTEIQRKCIPKGIGFKDVVGAAETGSGKTLAFGIPLISNILNMIKKRTERNKKDVLNDLYGIIIAPTRELALQIQAHLKEMTRHCDVTLCSVVGGLAPEKQERLLGRRPNIVIATPGRLMGLLTAGNEHLKKISTIRFLVIDECDRMFEKGHFRELKTILEQMKLGGGRKVQKFVFSATLSVEQSPKKHFFDDLCKSISLDPKSRVVDLTTRRITVEQLTQMKIMCETDEKEVYLFYFLLTYPGRTIVFANTISCIDRLSRLLRVLELNPLQLHAKKQQKQRLQRLDDFRAIKNGLLVCTDVAAHGLDIPEVDNVIHFQLPRDPKVYIHRSGRTARANKNGRTLIINGPEDFNSFNNITRLLKDKDNDMATLRVEGLLFKSLKERIELAKQIEREMFQQKRDSSNASWEKRVSREMDINDDADDVKKASSNNAGKETRKFLQGKQKHLKRLLKTNPVANQTKDAMFSKSKTITIGQLALP